MILIYGASVSWNPNKAQTSPLDEGGQGLLGLLLLLVGVLLLILGVFDVLSGPFDRGLILVIVGGLLVGFGRRTGSRTV